VEQYQDNDLLFITDIANQETKNTTIADVLDYVQLYGDFYTGSYSGSYIGNLNGTASVALNIPYPNPNNIRVTYSDSASYINGSNVDGTVSSSIYALTASYALNGGSGGTSGNFSEIITQTAHGFSIGDAIYQNSNAPSKLFVKASSTFDSLGGSNEVVGIVVSTSSNSVFTIGYGGVVDFQNNIPSYFGPTNPNPATGMVYFLSSSGTLNPNDPSIGDTTHTQISKPVLIRLSYDTGLIVNQRGLYTNIGNQISATSASYSLSGSYALTASYALNGGNGGTTNVNAYYDATPIGTVIAFASNTTAPRGYLNCDGTYYPLSGANGYPELADAIRQTKISNNYASFGLRYKPNGQGGWTQTDGVDATHFSVPDLRGQFVRGYNDSNKNGTPNSASIYDSGSGRTFASLQTDEFKSHQHSISEIRWSNTHGYINNNGAGTGNTNQFTPKTDLTGSIETRPVNISLNYYIKATQDALSSTAITQIAQGQYAIGGNGSDVTGQLNNNSVIGIQRIPVSATPPTKGQLLQYDGISWVPTTFVNIMPSYNVWIGLDTNYDYKWVKGTTKPSDVYASTTVTKRTPKYQVPTLAGEVSINTVTAKVDWLMFGVKVFINSTSIINFFSPYIDNILYIYVGDTLKVTMGSGNGITVNSSGAWTPTATGQYTLYFTFYNGSGASGYSLSNWIDGTNVRYIGPA